MARMSETQGDSGIESWTVKIKMGQSHFNGHKSMPKTFRFTLSFIYLAICMYSLLSLLIKAENSRKYRRKTVSVYFHIPVSKKKKKIQFIPNWRVSIIFNGIKQKTAHTYMLIIVTWTWKKAIVVWRPPSRPTQHAHTRCQISTCPF